MFFYTLVALQIARDTHSTTPAGVYTFGYCLCVVAVVMTIASLIMAVKLKKINDKNKYKKI
jgi:hypothetical protein